MIVCINFQNCFSPPSFFSNLTALLPPQYLPLPPQYLPLPPTTNPPLTAPTSPRKARLHLPPSSHPPLRRNKLQTSRTQSLPLQRQTPHRHPRQRHRPPHLLRLRRNATRHERNPRHRQRIRPPLGNHRPTTPHHHLPQPLDATRLLRQRIPSPAPNFHPLKPRHACPTHARRERKRQRALRYFTPTRTPRHAHRADNLAPPARPHGQVFPPQRPITTRPPLRIPRHSLRILPAPHLRGLHHPTRPPHRANPQTHFPPARSRDEQ